jgi:hypothetical protein
MVAERATRVLETAGLAVQIERGSYPIGSWHTRTDSVLISY